MQAFSSSCIGFISTSKGKLNDPEGPILANLNLAFPGKFQHLKEGNHVIEPAPPIY